MPRHVAFPGLFGALRETVEKKEMRGKRRGGTRTEWRAPRRARPALKASIQSATAAAGRPPSHPKKTTTPRPRDVTVVVAPGCLAVPSSPKIPSAACLLTTMVLSLGSLGAVLMYAGFFSARAIGCVGFYEQPHPRASPPPSPRPLPPPAVCFSPAVLAPAAPLQERRWRHRADGRHVQHPGGQGRARACGVLRARACPPLCHASCPQYPPRAGAAAACPPPRCRI